MQKLASSALSEHDSPHTVGVVPIRMPCLHAVWTAWIRLRLFGLPRLKRPDDGGRMLDDVIEVASGGWGWGVALAAGVGLLAGRGGRPMVKNVVRGYLSTTDAVKGWTANAMEQVQDLYAESKAEVAGASEA